MPQGTGYPAGGVLGVPRLVPGPHALLKRLNNLRNDAGVNVNAGCGGSCGTLQKVLRQKENWNCPVEQSAQRFWATEAEAQNRGEGSQGRPARRAPACTSEARARKVGRRP